MRDGIIESLRKEAETNQVFNAICHIFAVRERARQQVTLSTLTVTVAREGYKFSKEDLQKALKFLADKGLGKLEKDAKGRIVALKNIAVTLQSIGKVALDKKETLEAFSPAFKFDRLMDKKEFQTETKQQEPIAPAVPNPRYSVEKTEGAKSIVVKIEGKPVSFLVPQDIQPEDLARIVNSFL